MRRASTTSNIGNLDAAQVAKTARHGWLLRRYVRHDLVGYQYSSTCSTVPSDSQRQGPSNSCCISSSTRRLCRSS